MPGRQVPAAAGYGKSTSLFLIVLFALSFIALPVTASEGVRFTPPVLPDHGKATDTLSSRDLTPLPSPTGVPIPSQTSPMTVSPSPNRSRMSSGERSGDEAFRPLMPPSLKPLSVQPSVPTAPEIGPLQTPERLNSQRPIEQGLPHTTSRAIPLPPPNNQEEIEQVLRNGLFLEKEDRWADVLSHYEAALQTYRNDPRVVDRFRIARFHYDIGRRYHDSSYLKIVHSSKFVDSLNLYEEIISQVQKNYVHDLDWDGLFRHGIQDVDIALGQPVFCAKADLKASREKIDAYRTLMENTVDGWEIRNREDMKNGILRLAELAQQNIGLNPSILLMEFTCGMLNSLDRYTAYLTPNQLSDQYSVMAGNLVGLGVELRSDRESLLIVRVIQGSPAQEGGLKDGDRILTVDGIPTKGRDTDSAADLLQGEEGSIATLLVRSGRQNRELRIKRRHIEVPSVEDVRMLNEQLAYIKLTAFQSKTCAEMQKALTDLQARGMKALVLDLRRNPGGLLQVGVDVANMFLDHGAIVRTRGRNSNVATPYMATPENTWKMPLILLIDEESASASEIVAGAIRDHDRGIIIGRRSYGKGTIQVILSVQGGVPDTRPAGLRLTVEEFYSPKGWEFSGVGVAPHVEVPTEKRVGLAKLIDGRVQIPIFSRTVTSNPDDPFIRQAMETAEEQWFSGTARYQHSAGAR